MSSKRAVRLRAAVVAAALAAGAIGAVPVQGTEPSPEPAHVPGQRILAIGWPATPDPQPILDAIENPGGFVRELEPADDFVRVCGADTGIYDLVVAQFPDEATAQAQEPRLAKLPGVKGVYRNHPVAPSGPVQALEAEEVDQRAEAVEADGPDPDFGKQWGLRNTGQEVGDPPVAGVAGHDIRVEGAWADGATGEGVVVAILDQGMDIAHPDLDGNIWVNEAEAAGEPGVDDDGNGWVDDVNGWNYAEHSPAIRPLYHGTAVAGIVAAEGDNGIGVKGVAPQATLMPVDFVSYHTIRGTELGALGAFAYAIANGADVINNSWGTLRPLPGEPGSPLLSLAVQCAAAHDVAIAWAGGNISIIPDAWPAYIPAQNVLITGGMLNTGCQDQRSNRYAALLDTIAPSSEVWTAAPDGAYEWFAGTSAAAPHAAGVMALVRQRHPELSAAEVVLAVRSGARRPQLAPWSRSMGYLSAEGALAAAANGLLPTELPGTDVAGSDYHRCEVQPVMELARAVEHSVPQWLDIAPSVASQLGLWPEGVPWPSEHYPGPFLP